tara:strand:+ start:860 stop:1660 length:801 start_codon:yes stop_codon:yes gene_type:complete
MNALEWLKRRHAASEENRRRTKFENVPASQAWGGYVDKKGGQQLMVRQPEVKNKLVEKKGNATLTKEWVDNPLKVSPGIGSGSVAGEMLDIGPVEVDTSIPMRQKAQAQGAGPRMSDSINTRPGTFMGSLHHPVSMGQPSMAAPRVSDFQPDRDAMAFAKDRERRTAYLPERQVRTTRYQPDVIDRRQPTVPRETWGGDLNLTMPQDPITRGWIQDPATILNIGNLIKKMGVTIDYMKGTQDRIKENRDRRFRMFNSDPYSPVRKY